MGILLWLDISLHVQQADISQLLSETHYRQQNTMLVQMVLASCALAEMLCHSVTMM
jgi:hypothetical protein